MDNEEKKETELNISDIERYLESHKKEIMDHIMNKIFKDKPQIIKIFTLV
jgi:hemoglobin-like flavoprotein